MYKLDMNSKQRKLKGVHGCSVNAVCKYTSIVEITPSLYDVDTIPERQRNHFHPLVLDDILIELLDGHCHLITTAIRCIYAALYIK